MNEQLELQFVNYEIEPFVTACSGLVKQGKDKIRLRPFNQSAADFLKRASAINVPATFYVAEGEADVPLPPDVSLFSSDSPTDATVLFAREAKALSSLLMEYLDLGQGTILAPVTERYYQKMPLFLISIPKSGTHLLYGLVEAFGYHRGIICPKNPMPGVWYCIEYSNSHTSARDFFIDTVRRSPFGNRDHPFTKSPAVFIYRNPLDIVSSEANYYHQDGKTVFYSYLNSKSFEERVLTLIDDRWLLGSIRDRIGNFIAWLDFQNVIPVSFEELVGPNGGGDLEVQTRLIWSLQLKLHVPGNPQQFADRVFNRESPTFSEGQIGSYRKYFTPEAYERFYALPQDFMTLLGYDSADRDTPVIIPRRTEEFRKRPLIFSEADFRNTPILIESNYLGCNIVKYRETYYGIPSGLQPGDLTKIGNTTLSLLYHADDLNSVKRKILLKRGMPQVMTQLQRIRYTAGHLWERLFRARR
ncbi:hypothetical protein ACFLTY_00675 [Chloroflexota bacterium]